MLTKIIKPSEMLKPYIDYYYVSDMNFPSINLCKKQRVFPYGNIILVFHYKQPYFFQKKDEKGEIEPKTVICGQQTTYYDLTPSKDSGMIFIVFKPYGARMFFNMPMNEIYDQNIAFEYIVGNEALEIEDKIQHTVTIEEKAAIIDGYLVQKLVQNKLNSRQIIDVFNQINHGNRPISVKQLAEISCLSKKQFERHFSEMVGINPKKYLRIVRFQKARLLKKQNPFLDFTSLGYECGYYDQAHFIHDFKKLTGLTPRVFFNPSNL